MEIQIRGRRVKVTKALRDHVERRLAFALSRFGDHIGRVRVHLSDSDSLPDGAEKRCQIEVGLQRSVRVQETDADVFKAVDRAADRAARTVAHAIEQEHTRAQGPAPKATAPRRPTPR
jgi:putative sigma-54 modulation protein